MPAGGKKKPKGPSMGPRDAIKSEAEADEDRAAAAALAGSKRRANRKREEVKKWAHDEMNNLHMDPATVDSLVADGCTDALVTEWAAAREEVKSMIGKAGELSMSDNDWGMTVANVVVARQARIDTVLQRVMGDVLAREIVLVVKESMVEVLKEAIAAGRHSQISEIKAAIQADLSRKKSGTRVNMIPLTPDGTITSADGTVIDVKAAIAADLARNKKVVLHAVAADGKVTDTKQLTPSVTVTTQLTPSTSSIRLRRPLCSHHSPPPLHHLRPLSLRLTAARACGPGFVRSSHQGGCKRRARHRHRR